MNHTNFSDCIDETLSSFVSWLTSRLQCSGNYASLSVITPTLGVLLSGTKRARVSFARAGGVGYLVRHLTAKRRQRPPSASVQQVYDLIFCLWCMSLDCPSDEGLRNRFARDGAVSALAHLLKTAPREKVLRMTLACFRTLATLDVNDGDKNTNDVTTTSFVRDMIGCGVPKSLETVRLRRWNDSDLEDDLEFLRGLLSERTAEWSHWKVYEARIGTGVLRWDDLLHTADFFRANATKMEEGDFALASWDDDVCDADDDEVCESVAVCLFDLGEFVRHYPNGRGVAKRLGAKGLVMQYVNHPRFEVQEQALLCASKLLMRNWKVSVCVCVCLCL
eukprot:jgi/Psemu1/214057/e_gw1.670.47.1